MDKPRPSAEPRTKSSVRGNCSISAISLSILDDKPASFTSMLSPTKTSLTADKAYSACNKVRS